MLKEKMSMNRRYMTLLVIVALTLISGCVPLVVHDYYRPAATGGTLKQSACQEDVGPPNTIEFIRNNVKIQFRVVEEEKGIGVFFQLKVPKDNKVRLVDNVIHVSTPSKPTAMDVLLNPWNYFSYKPLWKIDEPLLGGTREDKSIFGTLYIDNCFGMNATIVMPKSDTIKIKLPELYINDQKIQLPEITFKKDRVLEFFVPLNC
jgi:hypothetical protein